VKPRDELTCDNLWVVFLLSEKHKNKVRVILG